MLIGTPYVHRTFGSFSPSFLFQINVYIGLGATQEEKPYVIILIIDFSQGDIRNNFKSMWQFMWNIWELKQICYLEDDSKPEVDNMTPRLCSHPGGSRHPQQLGEPGSPGRPHSWDQFHDELSSTLTLAQSSSLKLIVGLVKWQNSKLMCLYTLFLYGNQLVISS